MLGRGNYDVGTPDRPRKKSVVYHANLLRAYVERDAGTAAICLEQDLEGTPDVAGVPLNSQVLDNLPAKLHHLTADYQGDIAALLQDFPAVLGDVPTRTTLVEHDVELTDCRPIKQAPYRVNPQKREVIKQEVAYMLEHGIIKPSQSSYSAPCVLVEKSDGKSFRLCTDYRRLNQVTVPDSFPLPRIDTCIDNVGHAKYVTKFNLLKGYWQVPLTERAKAVSAFVTPDGLYQYTVTPFGMRNAPATL